MSGSLEEDFAEAEVSFGQREVQQRHEPRLLSERRAGVCHRGWHKFDQVAIAPFVEVDEEAVASVALPADEVYGVYRWGLPGRISVPDTTVIAVDWKAHRLRVLVARRPALGHVYLPWRSRWAGWFANHPACELL